MMSRLSLSSPALHIQASGLVVSGTLRGAWGRFRGVLIAARDGKPYYPRQLAPPPNWILRFENIPDDAYVLELSYGLLRRKITAWHIRIMGIKRDLTVKWPSSGDSICPTNFVPWGTGMEGATVTGTMQPATGKPFAQDTTVSNGIWNLQWGNLVDGMTYSLTVKDTTTTLQPITGLQAKASVC